MDGTLMADPRVKFSAPDIKTNIIKVTRTLPNGTEELIGQIYADVQVDDGLVQYYSTSLSGEEILPPTSDFIDIERQFEKTAHQMEEQSYLIDIDSQIEEYEERSVSIDNLRKSKTKVQSKVPSR